MLWVWFFSLCASTGDEPSAGELLQKTIAYHDPRGRWSQFDAMLVVRESRPDGTVREPRLTFDLPNQRFRYEIEENGVLTAWEIRGEACRATKDGQEQADPDCDKIKRYRNYYLYLIGVPMKLSDPGTRLDPHAVKTRFMDREVWQLRITYDEAVGKDIWYYYLDPENLALVGCRFYHDEAKNDGEYITYEGEIEIDDILFPQTRSWYTNREGKLLGVDTLIKKLMPLPKEP